MQLHRTRALVVALLLCLVAPHPAAAQTAIDEARRHQDLGTALGFTGATSLGLADLAIGGAAIYYAASEENGLPIELAYAELTLGILQMAMGAVFLPLAVVSADDNYLAIGSAALGASPLLITHGIYSVVDPGGAPAAVSVSLAPTGGWLHVRGAF